VIRKALHSAASEPDALPAGYAMRPPEKPIHSSFTVL
jgi:hypothetical protein